MEAVSCKGPGSRSQTVCRRKTAAGRGGKVGVGESPDTTPHRPQSSHPGIFNFKLFYLHTCTT